MPRGVNKNKRKVTSFDVAKEAGVSRSTVSAALNKGGRISEETTEKVRKAASRLGYMPKLAARSINSNRSYSIGLISCWDPNSHLVTRPVQGIVNHLRTVGYSLTICDLGSSHIGNGANVAIDYFREGRIDGLIAILSTGRKDSSLPAAIQRLRQEHLPFVLINTIREPDTDEVNSDNFHAGYTAARHLLNLGHRNIAFVLRRENLANVPQAEEDRYRGYMQALQGAGVEQPDRFTIRSAATDFTAKLGASVFRTAMLAWPERPTAVYAINDNLAAGVIFAAGKAGWRVPEDVAVVGTDDLEIAQVIQPALTSIAQPLQQMGESAAQLVMQRIEEAGPDGPVQLSLPCHLVARESSGQVG